MRLSSVNNNVVLIFVFLFLHLFFWGCGSAIKQSGSEKDGSEKDKGFEKHSNHELNRKQKKDAYGLNRGAADNNQQIINDNPKVGSSIKNTTDFKGLEAESAGVLFCGKMYPVDTQVVTCRFTNGSGLGFSLLKMDKPKAPETLDLAPLLALTQLKTLRLVGVSVKDAQDIGKLIGLEQLHIIQTQLSDFSFLSQLKNLKVLSLASTNISDLSPIEKLNQLGSLDISATDVSDLSSLSKLSNLKVLDLSDMSIGDISPLKTLVFLEKLRLYNVNNLSDISALRFLTCLENINLAKTGVKDISALSRLANLKKVDLQHTKVSTFPLNSLLPNLQSLNLSHTPISDLSGLQSLPSLTILNLDSTPVKDISPISNLRHLEQLNLQQTKITTVGALENLFRLELLNIASTDVQTLNHLSGLTSLEQLDCQGTKIMSLSGLEEIDQLRFVNVANTKISDLRPLGQARELLFLYASRTEIKTVNPILGLTKLRHLNCSYTEIEDIAGIEGLVELEILNLHGTRVEELAPLYKLPVLKKLYFDKRKLNPEDNQELSIQQPDIKLIPRTGGILGVLCAKQLSIEICGARYSVFEKTAACVDKEIGFQSTGPCTSEIKIEQLDLRGLCVGDLPSLSDFVHLEKIIVDGDASQLALVQHRLKIPADVLIEFSEGAALSECATQKQEPQLTPMQRFINQADAVILREAILHKKLLQMKNNQALNVGHWQLPMVPWQGYSKWWNADLYRVYRGKVYNFYGERVQKPLTQCDTKQFIIDAQEETHSLIALFKHCTSDSIQVVTYSRHPLLEELPMPSFRDEYINAMKDKPPSLQVRQSVKYAKALTRQWPKLREAFDAVAAAGFASQRSKLIWDRVKKFKGNGSTDKLFTYILLISSQISAYPGIRTVKLKHLRKMSKHAGWHSVLNNRF